MPLLPSRHFARVDRARLRRPALGRARAELDRRLADYAAAHARFAADGTLPPLARALQELSDTLSVAFDVAPRRVFLRDGPRPHRRRGGRIVYEVHGLCRQDGPVELWARTAARARPVAGATLLHTLVHEWVHHWDFSTLGASVHCRGYYRRLAQVWTPVRELLGRHAGR